MLFATRTIFIIIGLFFFGNDKAVANIRGTPGVDYPNYSSIPRTSFKCSEQKQPTGFYADPETRCQVFHYCYESRQETFLCPIGTTFNQAIKSCDYWYSSECDSMEGLLNSPRELSRINDQPFVPVTNPSHNVFEKMVALHESNENSYKRNDLPVFQPGELGFENGDILSEEGQYSSFPTSVGSLEEIPQTGEQDLNFVRYDHDAVEIEDVEIVLSEDDKLKTLHNGPNLGYAKEDRYEKPDESDSHQLSLEADEKLQRMYQNEYNSDFQINKMVNIDPSFSNMDDMSAFELNSDAVLLKRFSEVESKKRRIRRKPKYVVLQTTTIDNPDSQEVDSEDKTTSSMVTYAEGSDTPDINENEAEALQIGYVKLKKNRKPLRKDYSYSIHPGNVILTEHTETDIDGRDGFNKNSETLTDQIKQKDEIEITSEEMKQTVSNLDDMHEFDDNSFYGDIDNENSKLNDINDLFTLNEAVFDNQQLNIEEPMETEKSYLDSNLMNSDEVNQNLRSGNNYESFKEHWTLDTDENEFGSEPIEESSDVEASDLEESSDVEASDLEESSDVEASDLVESSDVEASDLEESSDVEASDIEESSEVEASDIEESSEVEASDIEESSDFDAFDTNLEDMYKSESSDGFIVNGGIADSDLGENYFVLEITEENSDIDNPFSDSETYTEVFDSNEPSDSYSSTKDFTDTEGLTGLDQVTALDREFEEKHRQSYSEFAENESTSGTNEINNRNVYFEDENAIEMDENNNLEEVDMDIEREGSSDFRVNSKYLNFEETNSEHFRVDDTIKDSERDRMPDTDLKEIRDTDTNVEIDVDSLEYFENEGQGYFVDDFGRIYIMSGENEESKTLIYVADIEPEDNSVSDTHMYTPQTENSLLTTEPPREDSHFPVEPEELVEADFKQGTNDPTEESLNDDQRHAVNSIASEDNWFGYRDTIESTENTFESQNENLIHQQESVAINFPETEPNYGRNSVAILQNSEESEDFRPNMNQTNSTDFFVDPSVNFIKDKSPSEQDFNYPIIKGEEINIPEVPDGKSDEMAYKVKEAEFHLSSIPLPANAYEKDLYNEKIKSSQEPEAINSNLYPASFYKELQLEPVKEHNGDSKPFGTNTQTAELLNIKTGLFRNIKSDLGSDEVKSPVSEVAFPSKIINTLFSSFSNPFQPTQEMTQDYFPLRSPKFRNLPDYPPRSGKVFKPVRVFKLINFGKKLLKMKQAQLKSLREYISP